ncbi:acyl-CoA dehydrogenase [Longispora fulva]|uniref:Alkylation response protein AidB-like acyl-CoA dehydrogenase n=1 Tax=Longispora fulva TaxID=619741 RepID=A0A8J7GL69_9ACTN|nr:acyl-CoA dehydrogenase family protein [Longispora fulva]MBG6138743.1 alkylation response protein AidB-like acyl-CoA dehydrogenase [Longispora fulva]GIG58237.1 acyl-CoA dehydrogenase [Longispora fulva]
MTISDAPPQTDLVGRATGLVEVIRKHATWQEENRVLHEEVLQGLTDAGIMKMRVPVRYGGYESDVRTITSVISELARGDGAVGWTVSTWTMGSWLAGLFPDEVQDEIFSDPSVRLCGGVTASGVATPTDGGVILNGRWHFVSGAPHSQWDTLSVMLATADGGMEPATIVVPMSDLTIVDDWHTAGLRATGSVTTIAQDVFVPQARVLPMLPLMMHGQHLSKLNADAVTWKLPFVAHATAVTSSSAVGMAKAAREAFFEKLPTRKIAYTGYEQQSEAPITHLQVAEAAVKLDEAEFHVRRAAERLDTKGMRGEQWTLEERAVGKMDAAMACLRAKESVDVLNTASGGSSIYSDQPMQRIERDIQALNLNGVLHPNTVSETYGRVLCGLEPNTHLI